LSLWIWVYIGSLVFPWIFYLLDLHGNNFDAHFSNQTLRKLRVKDNSFLRKVMPFKEGDIIRNGKVRGYRYCLYPRLLAFLIQTIILFLGTFALVIHLAFIPFIPDPIFGYIGGALLILWIIYTLIINVSSQGFGV